MWLKDALPASCRWFSRMNEREIYSDFAKDHIVLFGGISRSHAPILYLILSTWSPRRLSLFILTRVPSETHISFDNHPNQDLLTPLATRNPGLLRLSPLPFPFPCLPPYSITSMITILGSPSQHPVSATPAHGPLQNLPSTVHLEVFSPAIAVSHGMVSLTLLSPFPLTSTTPNGGHAGTGLNALQIINKPPAVSTRRVQRSYVRSWSGISEVSFLTKPGISSKSRPTSVSTTEVKISTIASSPT